MRYIRLTVLAAGLAGCAYATSATRAPGAPVLPPSPYAAILHAAPDSTAVLLGTVHVQGNNWQSPGDCDAQLQNEARTLGANAVLTTPATSSWGRGPRCTGTAYLLREPPK